MDLVHEMTSGQWTIFILCAFFTGVSKTGIPGMGILNVPLMALAFSAKMSNGLLLPMLAFADIAAVLYYRRQAHWNHILRLIPWALIGLAGGSAAMPYIDDETLKPMIGIIVLTMLVLNWWRERSGSAFMEKIPSHWTFAVGMGFLAGFTTQLANAAGPVMAIYLLSMRLPKNEFIGTGAWYFLILNWIKMPLFVIDGRISMDTFATDLLMLPIIIAGSVAGIFLVNKIPHRYFNLSVQFLAAAASVRLLFP